MSIYDNLMSEQIDSLAPALRKAQGSFEPVVKDKQAYGYKYADFANCWAAVEQSLQDNGLSLVQLNSKDEDKQQILVTTLQHDSGQWIRSIFPIENVIMKQCNNMQQFGAGITYAKRYALCGILGLPTEDDDAQSLGKLKQKEEIKDNAVQAATTVKEFMMLCKDNSLDVKDFARFAGVDSSKVETVQNAIENFMPLKETYLEVHDAAA